MAAIRTPLVVVLGATGAGKSRLAIEIAKAFAGEIISADSMQIYKGLDIISNKVTEEEQAEAPHHLISYLNPDHKHYNVVDFRDAALPIIDDLFSRSKMPIIVGGTNYYIESILWDFLINKVSDANHEHSAQSPQAKNNEEAVLCYPNRSPGPSSSLEVKDKRYHADLGPDSKKPKLDISSSCTFVISDDSIKSSPESRDLKVSTTSVQSTLQPASSPSSLQPSSSSLQPSSSSSLQPSSSPSSPLLTHRQPSASHTYPASPTSNGHNIDARNSPSPAHIVSVSNGEHHLSVSGPHDHVRNHPNGSSISFSSASKPQGDIIKLDSPCGIATETTPPSRPAPSLDANGSNSNSAFLGSSTVSSLTRPSVSESKSAASSEKLVLESCELTNSPGVKNVQSCVNSLGLPTPAAVDSPGSTGHRGRDGQRPLPSDLATLSASELYSHLQRVDPDTAARQHPNNTRKVLRALQVYYETGRTLSSLLEKQHKGQDGAKSGPLRYQDPCILWVKCRQPELDRRLDARVDTMLEKGLLAELEDFYEKAQSLRTGPRGGPDDKGYVYPHGMLQMLGFKEFTDYLQLSPQGRTAEEGKKVFKRGVDDLKQATRRYAKQQVRWITNRFCARPGPSVPPVYSVDSTDLSSWDQEVAQAIQVVRAFTQGEAPNLAPEPTQRKVDSTVVRQVCEVCGGRVFLHQHEWTGHLKSKKHRHHVKLAREREKLSSTLSARVSQLKGEKASPLWTSHSDNSKVDNSEMVHLNTEDTHEDCLHTPGIT